MKSLKKTIINDLDQLSQKHNVPKAVILQSAIQVFGISEDSHAILLRNYESFLRSRLSEETSTSES
jgi:hypothetical protein